MVKQAEYEQPGRISTANDKTSYNRHQGRHQTGRSDVSLESELHSWDGKSASAIAAISANHTADDDFLARLVLLAAKPEFETGATWLIKHRLENGVDRLSPELTDELMDLLAGMSGWEARLHCLQIFPHISLPTRKPDVIMEFVLACTEDANKFVRAWAYSGLHQLALSHPVYRERALAILEAAERTESAASGKVRLRRALKQGFPDRKS